MITDKGREIIGKFLLGQTSHYGEYLAIGCGYNQMVNGSLPVAQVTNKALTSNVVTLTTSLPHKFVVGDIVTINISDAVFNGTFTVTDVPTSVTFKYAKTNANISSSATSGTASLELNPARLTLDYEMVRVPVISRGLITEVQDDGTEVTKLTLKAELPTEQRYKITEVGLYSDSANARAGVFDSKRLSGFLPSEKWVDNTSQPIVNYSDAIVDPNNYIVTGTHGYVTDENRAWDHPTRKVLQQPPRYFDHSILVRGDFGTFTAAVPAGNSNYIKTNSLNYNFNENSAEDIFKFAYAIVPENPATLTPPDRAVIVVDFLNEYTQNSSYARWTIDVDPANFLWPDNNYYFYQVANSKKQDFVLSNSAFSWASVNGIRVYVSVQNSGGTALDSWYVLLDGFRLENISALNPLYGLVGYNVIDTPSGQPVVKRNNTVNFIEYRFSLQV